MTTSIETSTRRIHAIARTALLCGAVFAFAGTGAARADALATGVKNYKPFAVEHIGAAVAGAKAMQSALKAGDAAKAQAAWIKSRKGWEAIEPITGEFFPDLDKAVDAWPDAKQGYHAVEAPLFAGKLKEIGERADTLAANLVAFQNKLATTELTPQGLFNGMTGLAYEVGENKSKGGESPYAGTSLVDMHENVEGIEAVYKLVFEEALKAKDAKLAHDIDEKIEAAEGLIKVKNLKQLDQPALQKTAEELAVLLQRAAPKLGLKTPTLGG